MDHKLYSGVLYKLPRMQGSMPAIYEVGIVAISVFQSNGNVYLGEQNQLLKFPFIVM